MKVIALLASISFGSLALAQALPTEFPADATPIAANELQEMVSGKVYNVKLPDGNAWRMDFRSGGAYYWNNSRGRSDIGKWSAQEGKLCTEGRLSASSCNEVRKQGDGILLKRDNGEIVLMTK